MNPQVSLPSNALTSARRKEYHGALLNVLKGQLPADIYGAVYFSSPVGTVESLGLPYDVGQEEGSPVFNGDGMVLKIDFSVPGRALLSAQILKTPCYYADEVVSTVEKGDEYYSKGFFNVGISRLSTKLGVRNQLNTSMIPVRFPGEEVDRLLATFDTGRPYEFDPVSLQLYHPLGNNLEWKAQYFPFVEYVFPMIATTAHPSYDPRTGEFFTVNFTKTLLNMARPPKVDITGDGAESFLQYMGNVLDDLIESWESTDEALDEKNKNTAQTKLLSKLEETIKTKIEDESLNSRSLSNEEPKDAKFLLNRNEVFVVKRDAKGDLHSWRVLDEQGDGIRIAESMHQTGITEDYFVFIDSAFKISMDLLIPYLRRPFTRLSKFLRGFLQSKLKNYTHVYVVKRTDLIPGKDAVKAACLRFEEETVHFAADYLNPNQVITLHTAHNSSLCAAEWVRNYDKLAIDPELDVDPNVIGLPTIGEMDVSKIGKVQIKVGENEEGALQATLALPIDLIAEPLELTELKEKRGNLQQLGPNTWGIGLLTYHDYLAPDKIPDKVKYLFWQMYGLDYQTLTQYIYKMYDDESNVVAPENLLEYTKIGIPFSIVRQNTESMQLEDWFYFADDHYLRSIQYVPKNSPLPDGLEQELHGYLICTVIFQQVPKDPNSFAREIWIIDASNLAQGPVCQLGHEDLSFAFTIHSAWLPNPQVLSPGWKYNIREDYEEVLNLFWSERYAENIRTFMEEHVYPKVERNIV